MALIAPYVLYTLIAALVILAFFHFVIFSRLAFKLPKVEPDRSLPVSLVICARNESNSLQQLIPLMMDQDHDEFEVVVVNDRSDDDTWEILQWMKPNYPRLRPVNIQADEIRLSRRLSKKRTRSWMRWTIRCMADKARKEDARPFAAHGFAQKGCHLGICPPSTPRLFINGVTVDLP